MYYQSKSNENVLHMVLRSNSKVKIKSDFSRLTQIQKSPFYRGLKVCDELTHEIQHDKDLSKFKSKVKLNVK